MSEASSDSESCPSFLTESESEHESNWGEEKDQKEVDYTATAKEIICENVNITTENALKLNSGYHNMLKVLKNKLEILLAQCQDRQVEIEKQIEEYKNLRKPLVGKSRTSGYICGQPYFKDEDLYPGPHNNDYLLRKNVLKEFFPLDMFESTDSNWTVKDKVNILKGVKVQIIEFIERENRLKIKKLGNGLEAERLRLEVESLKKREVNDLWQAVKRFTNEYPGQKFEIDWLRISNVDISGRHSVAACVGLWNNYMLPGLVRDAWKAEEESRLLDAVERNGRQDWAQIAAEVRGRSPYQCFVHFQTTFSQLAQIKREPWTPEEDALLVRVVDENRIGSNIVWNKVVENMPLRNKIQCYNRYMFTLMRPTKHTKFTPEEDCIILAYVQQCGDDFRFVPPNLLPGRTNRQIWARYNHTLKYVNKRAGWTIEEDMRLMNFIKENLTDEGPRKISWAACSKALGNHSRLSCRTRYYTIEKFLEKNPDATLDDVPRKEKKLSSQVTNENWMKTFIDIRNEPAEAQEEPSTSGTVKAKKKSNSKRKPRVTERKPSRPFSDTIKCAIKQKFYDKFKYSFHYRFEDQTPAVQNSKVFCLNKAVFHLLNCTINLDRVSDYMESFTPNQRMFLRSTLSIRLNPGLMNFLRSAMYCFRFPPSYNTILGLRGVVLNADYPSDPKAANTEKNIHLEQTDEASYQYALETFRNRFQMIFYWTMLVVQQNPADATFIDADEAPKQEYYSQESLEQQQVALEQLSNLHKNRRLPRVDHTNKPSAPTLDEATVCLKQLELSSHPIELHQSVVKSDCDSHEPKLPKVQIISVKRITSKPVPIEHSLSTKQSSRMSSDFDPASVAQPFQAANTVQIVAQQPLAPYPLEYSILPEQVQIFEPTTPIYGQPVTVEAEKLPPPMEFVAQITIINPEDLPAVRVSQEVEEKSVPETIVPQPMPGDAQAKASTDASMNAEAPTIAEINEMADELYQNENGEHYDGDNRGIKVELTEPHMEIAETTRKEAEVDIQEVTQPTDSTNETVSNDRAAIEDIPPTTHPCHETDPVNVVSENAIEDENAAADSIKDVSQTNRETAADPEVVVRPASALLLKECTESTDLTETEHTDTLESCTDTEASQDHSRLSSEIELSNISAIVESSGSPASSDEENTVELEKLALDSLSSTQVTNVTNVGEFVIQELQEMDCPEDLGHSVVDDIPESETSDDNVHVDMESSEKELSSQSLDEPEWIPEIFEAPKRTYSRLHLSASRQSDRLKRQVRIDSHAWRWVHVDESNREDVQLHQGLWEECDPLRMQFLATHDPPTTEKIVPISDEIIVIDDDEVEIKDEPVDTIESQAENSVDAACIQQIIQTASNILRISEAYKIMNPNKASDLVGHPPAFANAASMSQEPSIASEIPVFFQPYSDMDTESLIVQTPSRVFDEQSNCYYYVDEVQDGSSLMDAPQTSEYYPAVYRSYRCDENSFNTGYPATVQFEQPRRILTPSPDPQSPSSSRAVTPQQSPKQIRTYTYNHHPGKAISKSHMVETLIVQQQSTDNPKIRKAKRPPRDPTKASPQQQHSVQSQALSLLDGLFRQPRLTPLRQRGALPLPAPSPSISVTSDSSSISAVPKRPSSSQRLCVEQPIKKLKLEQPEDESTSDQMDDQFDAVDVINMLAHEDLDIKEDAIDEEESEFLAQLTTTPGESSSGAIKMPPPPLKIEDEDLLPGSNSATQRKVRTIIQSTANRQHATNVHFKVGGITITKVQQK